MAPGRQQTASELRDGSTRKWSELQVFDAAVPRRGWQGWRGPEIKRRLGMNNDQSATVSLSLEDGILVLRSSKYELNSESQRFDDGNWHVVTVMHDMRSLRISVDDTYDYTSSEAPPSLYLTFGEIYFGGLPRGFSPVRGALPNEAYFVGCIQDVSININVVNFASSTDKVNAVLNTCPRDIVEYNPQEAFIYYPNGSQEKPKKPEKPDQTKE